MLTGFWIRSESVKETIGTNLSSVEIQLESFETNWFNLAVKTTNEFSSSPPVYY